jgi:hypothetical protein
MSHLEPHNVLNSSTALQACRLIHCNGDPACSDGGGGGSPEVCDDGIDNDNDGKTDCADQEPCFFVQPQLMAIHVVAASTGFPDTIHAASRVTGIPPEINFRQYTGLQGFQASG